MKKLILFSLVLAIVISIGFAYMYKVNKKIPESATLVYIIKGGDSKWLL
ncbi:MAG: hypothetical protein ACPL3A_00955 [Thermoanaerobacteraceae bacterium]